MKKLLYIFPIIILICSIIFTGCSSYQNNNNFQTNFIRFSLGKRQTDYYLDFTIEFSNKTLNDIVLKTNDFKIEINNETTKTISFLYEFEEVFYASPIIKSGETINLRVRTISQMSTETANSISFQYKNKIIVSDDIYISK